MSYNIFLSRYSNNDKIIKNSFSRKSSLGMSAYISDQLRYDNENKLMYNPKKGRDSSEVSYTALVLPSDIPDDKLSSIMGENDFVIDRIKNRFVTQKEEEYERHYVIHDSEVISHFWLENDRNISSVESDSTLMKNKNNKMRLYNLYLFASPVAHKHFPKELNLTHKDLREIDERAIYMVMHEFLLSKGMPVELGRHQNEENIIHYHVQSPARILNFVYQNEKIKVNINEFKAWISKSIMVNMRNKEARQQKKCDELELEYKSNPTDYNKKLYENWLRKYEDTVKEKSDLMRIIAGFKNSGYTYAKYFTMYQNKIQKDITRESETDGLFARVKGPTEKYLDSPFALDEMKKRYAEVLNQLLIEEGILHSGKELYTYVKSTKDYITIEEGEMWNIPDKRRLEVNREIKKIFQTDLDFEKQLTRNKKGKDRKKAKEKSRILVHALKRKVKKSIQYYKKDLAFSEFELQAFVNFWINKVEYVKKNYKEFIVSLLNKDMFNFDWKSKLVESTVEQKPIIKDKLKVEELIEKGFEEIEVKELDSSLYEHNDKIMEDDYNALKEEINIFGYEYVKLENHFEEELTRLKYSKSAQTYNVSFSINHESYVVPIFGFESIMLNAFNDEGLDSLKYFIIDYLEKNRKAENEIEPDNRFDLER